MASEEPKRDIAEFFRPYAKSNPSKTIPAKRPSPTPGDEINGSTYYTDKQRKQNEPHTPHTTSRVKVTALSPYKSPFRPRSGASLTIPIRSPKPNPSQTPTKTPTASVRTSRKGGLFFSAPKDENQEKKPLTFADIPISGQSIVKDGKVIAVRNSDDEDSDSLCSLDDILGRNRQDVPTGSSSPPDVEEEDLEAQRARSLGVFTNGRSNALVGRDKLRELTSKANGLNFDFSFLVDDHFEDRQTEANVTRAKQAYKVSDDQEKLRREGLIDKNVLASVVDSEQGTDNLQRLYNAVERTEALATEPTWSMFNSTAVPADSAPRQPFPECAAVSDAWFACLEDPTSRDRAYLSGYVAEKAAQGSVPDDVIAWTFSSIAGESRDDLRKSFVRVVQAASRRWTGENLTPSLVEQTFCHLGADPDMVSCANEIIPEPKASADSHAAPNSQLLSMIGILLGVAPDMTSKTLSIFIRLLMRLAIDTQLMSNSRICVAVEDAISSLLSHSEDHVSISVAQRILDDVGRHVKDPFLQTQALRHILPTSPAAASLRVRLANLFLLGPTEENTRISNLSTPPINLIQLISHLRSPEYDITRSAHQSISFNYSTLSSRITILDAALSNGGRPSQPQLPTSSSPSQQLDPSTTERTFNTTIDQLADRIKSIITSIADTGASHMRRTEAKEALNALHFRLLFGVRTKPRPKKSVFGGRDGTEHRAEERSKGKMQQFLDRGKERRKEKGPGEGDVDSVGGRPDLPGGLSQISESEELIRRQLGLGS